jgi:uncharacterized membrane protein YcaP (DUF421 family)
MFVVGWAVLRISGKRAVAEMSSFDLVVTLTLGTILANPISSKVAWESAASALSITVFYLLFSYLALNNRLRWVLTASPTVLVRNGDIHEPGLRRARVTAAELKAVLRSKGFTSVSDVELAMLEDTGKFSVIPKADSRPVQPKDLNLTPAQTFIPIPLVLDGQIIEGNLRYLKQDEEWLFDQLAASGVGPDDVGQVTLAAYQADGSVSVDRERNKQPNPPYDYRPGERG